MVNHKEILRLKSLGLTHREITDATSCGRNTVTRTLARAREQKLSWQQAQSMSQQEVSQRLFPTEQKNPVYKMPDYEWVHQEMQKNGVTLSLLWVEYCEQCRQNGELPYKSTQFNKYYADYVHKTKATMHLEHKPGETMQVDWAGQTAALVDTDTGERLDAYLFVAVLPYSGYAYTEAFLDMKQEAWITGHVNAYRYFGGVTRILTPDNLKTGVVKNSRTETVLNKAYQEMAEHYGTAILPARPRSPKDKAFVEGSVGVVSTWILAALRSRRFLSLAELNEAIREKLEAFHHKPFQKREGSRASCFAEEQLFLQPGPGAEREQPRVHAPGGQIEPDGRLGCFRRSGRYRGRHFLGPGGQGKIFLYIKAAALPRFQIPFRRQHLIGGIHRIHRDGQLCRQPPLAGHPGARRNGPAAHLGGKALIELLVQRHPAGGIQCCCQMKHKTPPLFGCFAKLTP